MTGIHAALGAADYGTTDSPETAFAIIDKFVSLGGRIIDTANMYAHWLSEGRGGESEKVIGDWLEQRRRSDVEIMTKVGSVPVNSEGESVRYEGLAFDTVHCAAAESAARLKTDYVDILLAHHDHPATPLLETWTAFTELVAAGKVQKAGVSNYSSARLAELIGLIRQHALAPLSVVQVKYSVIDVVQPNEPEMYPPFDQETRETMRTLSPDTVIFAYSPLLRGRVFEKAPDGEWPAEYDSPANRRKVAAIQNEAAVLGVSPSALVLKQIADEGIIPVTGTSNPERLDGNLALLVDT